MGFERNRSRERTIDILHGKDPDINYEGFLGGTINHQQTLFEQNDELIKPNRLHFINLSEYHVTEEHLSIYYNFVETAECDYVKVLPALFRNLQNHIPVFFVEENMMPEEYEKPSPEYLGYYMRVGVNNTVQSVFICPERIEEVANSIDKSFEILLAKILVHEFAHVIMDINKPKPILPELEMFYKYVEEPLANLITLLLSSEDTLEDFKEFMDHQPAEYKIGKIIFSHKKPALLHSYILEWMKIKTHGIKNFDVRKIKDWVGFVNEVKKNGNDPMSADVKREFDNIFTPIPLRK